MIIALFKHTHAKQKQYSIGCTKRSSATQTCSASWYSSMDTDGDVIIVTVAEDNAWAFYKADLQLH